MSNEVIPDEVKVVHIHKANEDKNSFIELMVLKSKNTQK